MKKYTEHILNKCPICGSKLQYHAYYQYSCIYSIKRNGEVCIFQDGSTYKYIDSDEEAAQC